MKIKETIKRKLAEKAVVMSAPGYDSGWQGAYYAVDTDGDGTADAIMHKQDNAPWNPWHDEAEAVSIDFFFDGGINPAEEVEDDFFEEAVDAMMDEILEESRPC